MWTRPEYIKHLGSQTIETVTHLFKGSVLVMPYGKPFILIGRRDDLNQTAQFGLGIQRHTKQFYKIDKTENTRSNQ